MVPGAPGQIRKQVQIMKKKRNKLERKLDEYNHTMELIRTIIPIAILILQVVILVKLI
jgi:heme/copper-type cytochrome/quinol oxidase subunit 2